MNVTAINLDDFERLARMRLSQSEFDSIAGGATDEISIRRNRSAYNAIALRPRRLVDISSVDVSTSVLGTRISLPVMLGPTGDQGRVHPDGECATAKAAGAIGTVMVAASRTTFSAEEIAQAGNGPLWFQQYLFTDRQMTVDMTHRAKAAGYKAICLTLDSTVRCKRERDLRNDYSGGGAATYTTAVKADPAKRDVKGNPLRGMMDKKATWSDLSWFAENAALPVVAKGIMTGEDAHLAAESGARAVIVSNHGGRQLDTTLSTIEVLPEVVDAVAGRIEVFVDGGIRRGTDVLKAIALGARAVLLGRPIYWALALGGEEGVRKMLELMREEIAEAMGQCGRSTVASIDRSLIATRSPLAGLLEKGPVSVDLAVAVGALR